VYNRFQCALLILSLVFHASELRLLFGPVPDPGLELEFANTMLDFYINFVNDLNSGRMSLIHFMFFGGVARHLYLL
jgi:hypothetical protein